MTNQPAAIGSYVDWYGKSPNDVEVAIHVSIVDVQPIMDTAGAPLEPLDALIVQLQRMDKQLCGHGFKRSDRLDKPTYGGGGGFAKGGKKPDTPAPTGIIVPEHCGQPMKYVRYKKANAKGHEGRGVPPGEADMWVCRKDKQCEDVTSGQSERAHASFDMRAAADAPKPAAESIDATGDKPVNWAPFFRECSNLGVAKEEVWRIAGVVSQTELLAKVKTAEKLDQLLERVKRARPAA